MAIILAVMSLFYKYVPLAQDTCEMVKSTSDEEIMPLIDSTARNYNTSIKTNISDL